jgi:hypothetical protein
VASVFKRTYECPLPDGAEIVGARASALHTGSRQRTPSCCELDTHEPTAIASTHSLGKGISKARSSSGEASG